MSAGHPLDNPIWNALSTRHSRFDEGNDHIKIFPSTVSPFISKQWSNLDSEGQWRELYDFIPSDRTQLSMLFAEEIQFPADLFDVQFSLPLHQLICPHPVKEYHLSPTVLEKVEIRALGPDDVPQMLELTALTKPGPFLSRTFEFGHYVGIFDKATGQLAAMLGGRLQVPGFSEVSAICTHPDHLGNGYASFLIAQACQRIQAEGCTPFLHCKIDNVRAIEVYKKMGFEVRAEMHYTIFQKR